MFYLTHQERKVLFALGALILLGSILRFSHFPLHTSSRQSLSQVNVPRQERTRRSININTASGRELEKLPGIGAVLAQRIIDYRLQAGPFAASDELKNVKGIGAKKLEAIKNYLIF